MATPTVMSDGLTDAEAEPLAPVDVSSARPQPVRASAAMPATARILRIVVVLLLLSGRRAPDRLFPGADSVFRIRGACSGGYKPPASWWYPLFQRSSWRKPRAVVPSPMTASSRPRISARWSRWVVVSAVESTVWWGPPASSQPSVDVAKSGLGRQTARPTGSR